MTVADPIRKLLMTLFCVTITCNLKFEVIYPTYDIKTYFNDLFSCNRILSELSPLPLNS